ncbi:uncharacterized protein RAG0_03323 [Rhynchosporium agropyri]|uniref:Protamine P1 n=1 Tax=Rhynchosporium agropyri TaxID=914238 RepID=A0A1E1K3Y9_9HELO|nr:uncharacterized protein RAG0_03323 [Rhynchosporium agropyri]
MGPFKSSYDIDNYEDEPYHCRPPTCDEDDIVCLGSDSEQTTEEVAQKHQRYEAEAQRIVKGKLPILQSASLKGPFEKGWVNPWVYRPIKKQDQEWWQPGSEDMLFTRAKVMERAAAHGLGYLKPADALEWCKATARAEAQIINETQIQSGQIMRSVERDGQSDSEDMDGGSGSEDSHEAPSENRLDRSGSALPQERPELSMLNHDSRTPNGGGLDNDTENAKRSADLQWLKGSYVSKRARWEGPAVATPTPFFDVLQRDRRRRQLSARPSDQPIAKTRKPSRLSKSFNGFKEVPRHTLDPSIEPRTPREIEQPRTGPISSFGPREMTSLLEHEDFGHQPDDLDELQDTSHSYSFQRASQSSIKSQKIGLSFNERPPADLELDDLVVITPRAKPKAGILRIATSLDSHMLNTGPDDSYELPKLTGRSASNDDCENEVYHQEDSFITEVAPSSRNVETFKFRKRKQKFSQALKKLPISGPDHDRRRLKSDAESKHSDRRHIVSDTVQIKEEGRENIHVNSYAPVSSHKSPPTGTRQSISSQTTPPKSDEDEACVSWDMVGDMTAASSFRRATEGPQTTSPPKSRSSVSISPHITPKITTSRLPHSSDPNSLLKEPQSHDRVPFELSTMKVPPCSENMSTQSFNTTPSRSMLSPVRHSLPLLRGLFTQQPKAEATLGRFPESEMDKIQVALSQACPTSSAEDGPHKSPGRDSSELYLADGTAVTPLIRSDRSSGGLAPGLPNIEFTDFANESFLYLGGYLSEPASNGPTALFDNSEPTPPPASLGHQVRERFEDLPHIENASLMHAELAHKCSQVGDELVTSTAVVAEEKDDRSERDYLNLSYTPSVDPNDHSSAYILCQPASVPAELVASAETTSIETHDEAEFGKSGSQTQRAGQGGLQESSCKVTKRTAGLEEDHAEMQQEEGAGLEEGPRKELEDLAGNDIESTSMAVVEYQIQTPFDTEPKGVQNVASGDNIMRSPTNSPNLGKRAEIEGLSENHDRISEPDKDQCNDPATGSEASWQGCGPQSPWTAEKIEPLTTCSTIKQVHGSLPLDRQEAASSIKSVEQDKAMLNEEISWISMGRPSTPDSQLIRPFKDFSTPTPSPGRHYDDPEDILVDTQTILEAATRNPWTGRSKSRSTGKIRKCVSFGVIPLDEARDSQQDNARNLDKTPHSPPPPQADPSDEDEDIFHDGTTVTTTSRKHFVAATRKRHFRRILPDKRSSQLASSPTLLEAQAEAFIAADHDIPAQQCPTSAKDSPTRHLRSWSNPNTNVWNEVEEDDTMVGNSFLPCPIANMPVPDNAFAGFDMASALGEAGDFLEDWSVDSVLKNSRDNESATRVESNDMRGRRLFGPE